MLHTSVLRAAQRTHVLRNPTLLAPARRADILHLSAASIRATANLCRPNVPPRRVNAHLCSAAAPCCCHRHLVLRQCDELARVTMLRGPVCAMAPPLCPLSCRARQHWLRRPEPPNWLKPVLEPAASSPFNGTVLGAGKSASWRAARYREIQAYMFGKRSSDTTGNGMDPSRLTSQSRGQIAIWS
jgi:hypothetical protein